MWSGFAPNRYHPAICSASPRCSKAATHKHTERIPVPWAVFCKYKLDINSQQADRYSQPSFPAIKTPTRIFARVCRVANQLRHTREECRVTHAGRYRDFAYLVILEGGSVCVCGPKLAHTHTHNYNHVICNNTRHLYAHVADRRGSCMSGKHRRFSLQRNCGLFYNTTNIHSGK